MSATTEEISERIDDDDYTPIKCCRCGQPTTWDATYQDLCYRCCRAANE